MRHFHPRTLSVFALLSMAFLAVAGCSKPIDTATSTTSSAVAQTASVPQAKAASRLGDLSSFQSIAIDVAAKVDKGDLAAAKIRIKDLEIAWDAAEAGLKPRAADDWHMLDKSIDRALSTVRAEPLNQVAGKKAMSDLLTTFNTLQ